MASIWSMPLEPCPTDGVYTETSEAQAETERTLLHTLRTEPPSPPKILDRNLHASYIGKFLLSLPAPYVSLDASRPWLMYWALHSFDLLGIGLDDKTKAKAAETILAFQHPRGGFGGGPGQDAHLLPTYASVCALAIVGDARSGYWDRIDRKGMYEFFMRCKQPDGSFVVCEGGEVDVRGVYCLLVCATLLDLLTPELVEGTDRFIASCQTYEGGFSASASTSSPFSIKPGADSREGSTAATGVPLAEAHGGYTSCALFSWYLLQPLKPPSATHENDIDANALLRWAAMQQGTAIEGGGFRGRTNKLVDGCYGWWVGGLFAVLDGLVREKQDQQVPEVGRSNGGDDEWEDVEENQDALFNRIALQEFILICAQSEKGGLRDKPGKSADLYHTNNNLSGLSSAQHRVVHDSKTTESNRNAWRPSEAPSFLLERPGARAESAEQRQIRRREVYARALGWKEDEAALHVVGGNVNRVNTTSPVFNILLLRIKPFVQHFYGQSQETS